MGQWPLGATFSTLATLVPALARRLWVCLLLISGSACAQLPVCEKDNADLQLMSKSLITFTRNDGSEFAIEVKTAMSNRTRAAGFQRVCASTIAAEPILFVFGRPFKAQFHMNDVVAPIDIAFFNKDGEIDSIQAMQPYVIGGVKKPLYGPKLPVIGALEAYPGFYIDHNIDTSSKLTWQAIK